MWGAQLSTEQSAPSIYFLLVCRRLHNIKALENLWYDIYVVDEEEVGYRYTIGIVRFCEEENKK